MELNPQRLSIRFMSSGDGILYTKSVNDFCKRIKDLGPLGRSEEIPRDELKCRLDKVTKLIPYIKIVKRAKLESRLEDEAAYDALFTRDEIERLFNDVVSYYIDPAKCQACMICRKRCPVEAIEGGKNRIHVVDQQKCIKCGTCFEVCPPRFGAVQQISGEPVPAPIPEEARVIVRAGKVKA